MSDDLDRPYRLKDILPLAYPDGSMKLSGLRKEVAKGNLTVEFTAGKYYTTLRAIGEMREKCRAQRKARVSGSEKTASTRRRASSSRPASGSLSTQDAKQRQAAVAMMLAKLKPRSPNTSSPKPGDRSEPSGT